MSVGGTAVAVGAGAVSVGGTAVSVGGRKVSVAGTAVSVGAGAVAVGVSSVAVDAAIFVARRLSAGVADNRTGVLVAARLAPSGVAVAASSSGDLAISAWAQAEPGSEAAKGLAKKAAAGVTPCQLTQASTRQIRITSRAAIANHERLLVFFC